MTTVGNIWSAIAGGNLGEYIRDGIRELFLWLDSILYSFISIVYRVFYLVADANLFDFNDESTLGGITSRIYTVLGVVMLFVFAYNIILLISNPNKLDGDNSLTKLAKNAVISIVIITLLPTIFNYMHVIQHDILESNVIGNIILAGSDVSAEENRDRAGTKVALTIFSTFFHPLDNKNSYVAVSKRGCDEADAPEICSYYIGAWDEAVDANDFRYFSQNGELDEELKDNDDPEMEYLFVISTAAGILALYMFLSFTIDAGIRVAKLSALQLVAPVPVILRITKPSGGIFSKWLDELISSYISVFVRLAIIFFSIFSIQVVTESIDLFPVSANDNGFIIAAAANVVIVFGILQFAKDAPGLLEAIAGSKGGKIKLSIKDKLNENEYGKRAVSAVGTIGGNLGRMAFNTMAGRDANGKKVTGLHDRLANGWHQLLNLPTNVFRGGYEGWRNGNVDFSHGVRDGLSNMRDAIDTSMDNTRTAINERMQKRKNSAQRMRDALGFGVVIPGVSYWADVLNERLNMGAAESDEAGGFMNALSNSINGVNNGQVAQSGHIVADQLRRPMFVLNKDKKQIEAERDAEISINRNNANKRRMAIDEKLASFDDEERHLVAEKGVATEARDRLNGEIATYDSQISSFQPLLNERNAAANNIAAIQKERALKEQQLTERYEGLGTKKSIVDAANNKYAEAISRINNDNSLDENAKQLELQKALDARDNALRTSGLDDYLQLQKGIELDDQNIAINNATIAAKDAEIKQTEQTLGTDLKTLESQRQIKVTERDQYSASITNMENRRDALARERTDLNANREAMIVKINEEAAAEEKRIKDKYKNEVYQRQYDKAQSEEYKKDARVFINEFKEQYADDIYRIGKDKFAEKINELKYDKDGNLVWGEGIESLDDLLERYANPESPEDLKKMEEFIKKLDKLDRHDAFSEIGKFSPRPARRRGPRRPPNKGGDKK